MPTLDYKDLIANMATMGFVPSPLIFVEHTIEAGGCLPNRPAAHAAYYYCICAHTQLREVDEGAVIQGEADHQIMLNNTVRSISAMYGLDSPSDLIAMLPYCKEEAERLDLGWDQRFEQAALVPYITKDNS